MRRIKRAASVQRGYRPGAAAIQFSVINRDAGYAANIPLVGNDLRTCSLAAEGSGSDTMVLSMLETSRAAFPGGSGFFGGPNLLQQFDRDFIEHSQRRYSLRFQTWNEGAFFCRKLSAKNRKGHAKC